MAAPTSAENTSPLAGKHVVVTRPSHEDEEDILQEKLRTWGAQVSLVPLVEIQPTEWSCGTSESVLGTTFDWLFFTSRNAVQQFFQGLSPQERADLDAVPIAVVGPATGQSLQAYGREPAFISPQHDAESAAKAFCSTHPCNKLRVLWPCGNLANQRLFEILTDTGAKVTPLVVYKTMLRQTLSDPELAALKSPVDMLVFTSPSAVSAFVALTGSIQLAAHFIPVACLGPKTAAAAVEKLGHVPIQANPVTLEALANNIYAFYATQEGV